MPEKKIQHRYGPLIVLESSDVEDTASKYLNFSSLLSGWGCQVRYKLQPRNVSFMAKEMFKWLKVWLKSFLDRGELCRTFPYPRNFSIHLSKNAEHIYGIKKDVECSAASKHPYAWRWALQEPICRVNIQVKKRYTLLMVCRIISCN